MREHIPHVGFDMHQASVTVAWLLPGANTSFILPGSP
jgi:hypothetical protein